MKEKLISLFKKPVVLLAAAAVLLLASTAGATQAALTYYSGDYETTVDAKTMDVTLLAKELEATDYTKIGDKGSLLGGFDDQNPFVVGKTYDEQLKVQNTGSMDAYIRVVITKKWVDGDGKIANRLLPDYIELTLANENDWIKDTAASTTERTVLYYKNILKLGAETSDFAESVRIDNAFETTLTQSGDKNITYDHKFDDYSFNIQVEVDAVQTHNAEDAIRSAWGNTAVTLAEDGTLSISNPATGTQNAAQE